MIVAITGSSGFVGNHLKKRLINIGYEIIDLDLSQNIDITNWDHIKNTRRFDCLIHLAAKTFVPDSYKCPKDFYTTNIIGTLHALELCREKEAKMIYISSYVYGNPQYLPIDELHPISSFNPYSQSKIIGENLCKSYEKDFRVKSIIIRPFNLYGPGQNEFFLIPFIIKQLNKKVIKLKDSQPKRDYLFIEDFIDALIKCVDYHESNYEVFNIGAGESYSVELIANKIISASHKKPKIKYLNETRENEIMNTIANIQKAKSKLNWAPKISLEQGLTLLL